MVKRPGERPSDRLVSIGLSVLVHAAIVGALLWGWWQYRHTQHTPPPTLAIEGTVVQHAPPQARTPVTAHPSPVPTPAPAPPKPPTPTPAQLAQQQAAREAAAQEAAAKQAAEKAAAQKAAAQKLAAQQAEQAAALKEQQAKAAAAKQAAEKEARDAAAKAEAARLAEAKRKAAEEAARQAKLAAERKAKEEAELRAKQEAAREQQQLAAQLKAEQAEKQREADLRSQMQAEERLDALERGPAETEYVNLITARISRAWNRPPSWQSGTRCVVHITQIPGGEVTNVQVQSCSGGDEAARQSVQTAAYRASPLPAPPDPALFDPNITVTFAPDQ